MRDKFVAELEVALDGAAAPVKLSVDQAELQTVIPALQHPVLVVNGAYRGEQAILLSIDTAQAWATLKITSGLFKGQTVDRVAYVVFGLPFSLHLCPWIGLTPFSVFSICRYEDFSKKV